VKISVTPSVTGSKLIIESLKKFNGCTTNVFLGYLSKEKGGKTVKQR
jgi:hypothetical protein